MAEDFTLFGTAPQTQRQSIFDTPTSLGDFLSATNKSTFENSYTRTAQSFGLELYLGNGEKIPKEKLDEISKSNNVSIDVPPEGMEWDKYKFNLNRKTYQAYLDQATARKPDGFVASALGIGTAVGTDILDPIGMAVGVATGTAFLRYGAAISKATTTAGRTAARFGLAAAEGAAATAAIEPAYFAMKRALGDDYDGYDSFANIAFGAGFGGTLSAGGGLIGEAFGKLAKSLPKSEADKIMVAAARIYERDGTVDISEIINAAARSSSLRGLDEIAFNPNLVKALDEEGPVSISSKEAEYEYIKQSPEYSYKLEEINQKIAALKSENVTSYEKALNDFNEAKATQPNTFEEADLQDKKLQAIEKKYGKGFVEEANNYIEYKKYRDKVVDEKLDKRQRTTAEKKLNTLNEKYNGRFASAYDSQRFADQEYKKNYDALNGELSNLQAEYNLGIQIKKLDMLDKARKDYAAAKNKFARQYNSGPRDRELATLRKTDEEFAEMRKKYIDSEDYTDDAILELKQISDEFEERTGIIVEEIDEQMFNADAVISAAKKYLNCVRR